MFLHVRKQTCSTKALNLTMLALAKCSEDIFCTKREQPWSGEHAIHLVPPKKPHPLPSESLALGITLHKCSQRTAKLQFPGENAKATGRPQKVQYEQLQSWKSAHCSPFETKSLLFYFSTSWPGVSANAVPHYHKLCSRDSHIWGIRTGQHNRGAMVKPRLGWTTFLIMVSPLPGKYELDEPEKGASFPDTKLCVTVSTMHNPRVQCF